MTSLKRAVLKAAQRSVPLTSLLFAADNLLAASGLRSPDPAPDEHLGGVDVEADVAYARAVADHYLSRGPIAGRVAEIGPGGSAAVGLFLLARGAESIDLIDRFAFSHDPARQAQLYARIIAQEPRLREMFGSAADLRPHVRAFTGEEAAAEIFFRSHKGYDAIVSNAVLEHLYDPISALEAMASALAPGGRLIHQIDFRDHGMFTGAGRHDLTFLTIPSWFYPHMSRRRGRPNRVLVHRYRAALERLGLPYEILATHLVDIGILDEPMPYPALPEPLRRRAEARVEELRGRLAPEFRSLPVEDLAVSSVLITARKA